MTLEPGRYHSFLRGLTALDTAMVHVDGAAVRLCFAFDDIHDWLDVNTLAPTVAKDDEHLLYGYTSGGRAARPEYFLAAIDRYSKYENGVTDRVAWAAMTARAHAAVANHRRPLASYALFAETVTGLLCTVSPFDANDTFNVEVISRRVGRLRAPIRFDVATSSTRIRPEIEMVLGDVENIVDRIEVLYPGVGHRVTLRAEHSNGAVTELDIVVPRSEGVANLFDQHGEFVYEYDGIGVVAELNRLSDAQVETAVALARTGTPIAVASPDGLLNGRTKPANECDAWTLLHAVRRART